MFPKVFCRFFVSFVLNENGTLSRIFMISSFDLVAFALSPVRGWRLSVTMWLCVDQWHIALFDVVVCIVVVYYVIDFQFMVVRRLTSTNS